MSRERDGENYELWLAETMETESVETWGLLYMNEYCNQESIRRIQLDQIDADWGFIFVVVV